VRVPSINTLALLSDGTIYKLVLSCANSEVPKEWSFGALKVVKWLKVANRIRVKVVFIVIR
jgi:hypothetical protein